MKTRVMEGSTFYGSDGKKIGKAKQCERDYCMIDTGFLGMGPEYYIPESAIAEVSGNDVYLNVPSGDLELMGWRNPPEAGTARRQEVQRTEEETAPRQDVQRAEGETAAVEFEEEEIKARKRRTKAGEVEVGKEVVEEERTISAPVTREEAVIKEREVSRPGERAISEEEVARIPLKEETISVHKEPRVYKEIEVEKRTVTEPREVTETVRKEVPKVHETGKHATKKQASSKEKKAAEGKSRGYTEERESSEGKPRGYTEEK